MEKKELEIRRQLFEIELRYIVFALHEPVPVPENAEQYKRRTHQRRLELEQFKLFYEREFEAVKNIIQDETVHAKFLELKI